MDFKNEERGMKLQNSFNPTKGDVLLCNPMKFFGEMKMTKCRLFGAVCILSVDCYT